MASSSDLKTGADIIVSAGPLKGMTGTVIDPKAVPDGLPNQRKVLVSLDGEETYILPRLLDLGATLAPAAPAPAALTMADITDVAPAATLTVAEPITDPMDPALDRFRQLATSDEQGLLVSIGGVGRALRLALIDLGMGSWDVDDVEYRSENP